MKLRIIPQTPQALRELPYRETPDEYRVTSYRTTWDEMRFGVEARRKGRVLGDRQFPDYATARAHADMNAKWDGACVTDFSQPAWGHPNPDHSPSGERCQTETSASTVDGTTPHNRCERCGAEFGDSRGKIMRSMARKRFCSERCRKAAEAARWYGRRKSGDRLDQNRIEPNNER
jgi:hypothetical protein